MYMWILKLTDANNEFPGEEYFRLVPNDWWPTKNKNLAAIFSNQTDLNWARSKAIEVGWTVEIIPLKEVIHVPSDN